MNFNNLVKLIVDPVLVLYGFKEKNNIKGIVEYEDSSLMIILSYDYNSSYEVDMTLVFKESALFYGYNDLKEYFHISKSNLSAIQIKDETTLIKWLTEINLFLRENLKIIIDNQKKILLGLEEIRQYQVDEYEKERNNRLLSEGVEKYWQAKDYPGLVNFLEKQKINVEGIFKKKYEFALKMMHRK